jgi:hypothetical protein
MGKRKAIGLLAVTTNTPFTMTPNAILFDTRLPALVRVCYSALEDFSGEHLTCWPGYEALAKKVGCSARWIPVLLKRLVEAGLLLVQYRQGKTNIYTLLGRVERQKATQEDSPLPMKPDNYEQKQAPKTNNKGGSRPFNDKKGSKKPIDFSKYEHLTAPRPS